MTDPQFQRIDEKLRLAFEVLVARGEMTPEQATAMNGLLDEIDELDGDEFKRRLEAVTCLQNIGEFHPASG